MVEPMLAVYRRFTTLCSNYTQYFYSLTLKMTITSEKMMESPQKRTKHGYCRNDTTMFFRHPHILCYLVKERCLVTHLAFSCPCKVQENIGMLSITMS